MTLLTRHEAIAALGTSWQGLRRRVRSGRLPYVETDRGRMYRESDVQALAEHVTIPMVCRATGMVLGELETYRVEHVARRPGGDLDVVVSARPHDHRAAAYLAFRKDAGEWRPLAGRERDLESAVHHAEHEARWAGWDSPELAALLDAVEAS